MKVIFFGTPQFASNVLSFLLEKGIQVVAVVTRTDKAQHRSARPVPSPVKKYLLGAWPSLPLLQPERVSTEEFVDVLLSFHADLFVVVAYGEILKKQVLDAPFIACINLHASLLPKYRGAAPIQRAIMAGEEETGVTIMHMAKKMDAGDIIRASKVPINLNDTFLDVEKRLCDLGSKLLYSVIREFETGSPPRTPQDESCVSYAPKIEVEDCKIDWSQSAVNIHNLIRGVYPNPGAWSFVDIRGVKKRLKIKSTSLMIGEKIRSGEIVVSRDRIFIGCGEGAIQLLVVQLEGKKEMSAIDFIRGTHVMRIF